MNTSLYSDEPEGSEHPLPLMDGGVEIRRSVNYTPRFFPYVLRFTPEAQDDPTVQLFGFDEILNEFLFENQIDIYVLVCESHPKIHYHLYLESELKHEDLKKLVRKFLYSYYVNRTRGFGTKQYSALISEKPLNAIIYNLKQIGRQEFSGFTPEFIDECRKLAFVKKETDFEKDLIILTQNFLNDKLVSPVQFGSDIAILYSKYDKRVHWRDIQGYVNSKLIKRDISQSYILASKYLTF